jgi:hypothetical protein
VKNFYCIFVIYVYGPEAKVKREWGGHIMVVEIQRGVREWGEKKHVHTKCNV